MIFFLSSFQSSETAPHTLSILNFRHCSKNRYLLRLKTLFAKHQYLARRQYRKHVEQRLHMQMYYFHRRLIDVFIRRTGYGLF